MDLERCVRETRLTPLKESVFVRRLYACLWWRRCVDLTPLPIPMSVSWRRPSAIHRDASRWCAKAPVVSLVTCKNQYLYLWGPPDCYFQIKGKIYKKNHPYVIPNSLFNCGTRKKNSRKIFGCSYSAFKQWNSIFLTQKFFYAKDPKIWWGQPSSNINTFLCVNIIYCVRKIVSMIL